jgi:hypothetical protein
MTVAGSSGAPGDASAPEHMQPQPTSGLEGGAGGLTSLQAKADAAEGAISRDATLETVVQGHSGAEDASGSEPEDTVPFTLDFSLSRNVGVLSVAGAVAGVNNGNIRVCGPMGCIALRL